MSRLCPVCFREYKDSKEGRRQRMLKIQKQPNTYGKGRWPSYLYHNEDTKLCALHHFVYQRKVAKAYNERDLFCKALGFSGYKAYLASDLWFDIRLRIYTKANGLCALCGDPAHAVHHYSYDLKTLKGEDDSQLHALCKKCHEKIEYYDSGDKVLPKRTRGRAVQVQR